MDRDSDPLADSPPDLLQLLCNKINVVLVETVEEQPSPWGWPCPTGAASTSVTVLVHLNSTPLYCQRNTIKRLIATILARD